MSRARVYPRDKNLQNYLKDLKFSLSDTLRLIGDPDAPLFIANKLLGFINFKYLAGKQGIHAVGSLLGLEEPWEQISTQLARDRAGLEKLIEDTTKRRNDIVHRADRSQSDPGGDAQEIGYAWSKQAVDTISHVCFALDELVTIRMVKLKEAAERAEGT